MVEDMNIAQLTRENSPNINKPLVSRLKAAMLKNGLNPKTLAERANVGRSFVYDILNGKSSNPTSTKLTAIAEQLGVSVQYLLSGIHSSTNSSSYSEIIEVPTLKVQFDSDGNNMVTPDENMKPYYFENSWIKDKLNTSAQNLRAIKVTGDSMRPTLIEHDIILINTIQIIPNPPGLFVLFDGLGLHAKRLEMISKEKIRVMSDNSQYMAYEMNSAEIKITGRIVWVGREL